MSPGCTSGALIHFCWPTSRAGSCSGLPCRSTASGSGRRASRTLRSNTMDQSDPFHLFPYRAIVDHPAVAWPNGAKVAVWVIPNIEHFHIELGAGAPDVRNHSRRDYGNRVGVWRLMDVLSKHGVRGTVALNGEVGRLYPRIMKACVDLNWELMGHGLTNSVMLTGMSEAQE